MQQRYEFYYSYLRRLKRNNIDYTVNVGSLNIYLNSIQNNRIKGWLKKKQILHQL